MLKQIEMNISNIIDNLFDVRNMKQYLQVAAQFPLYDYKNQILIYKQFPDAKIVAGKKAYEAGGRIVSDNARPIVLLYPVIKIENPGELYIEDGKTQVDTNTGVFMFKVEPKYAAEYRPEIVYEISDTVRAEGEDEKQEVIRPELTNRIKYLTEFTIREGDEAEFNDITGNGIFNPDEKEFVLRKITDNADLDRTLIELYITYDFYYSPLDANIIDYAEEVKKLVIYEVLSYFSLLKNDFSLIFVGKISPEIHEIKEEILSAVQIRAAEIVQDLSVYFMSFDEVAIANSVIRSGEYEDLEIMFDKAITGIADKKLIDEMNKLKEKLYFSQEGFLEALYNAVIGQKLYSWPPRMLPAEGKRNK